MQAAAALAAAFPPRGLIRLLSPEHTEQGKPRIERLVAEEYILDTMHYFDGDRLECAVRLATGERSEGARLQWCAESASLRLSRCMVR